MPLSRLFLGMGIIATIHSAHYVCTTAPCRIRTPSLFLPHSTPHVTHLTTVFGLTQATRLSLLTTTKVYLALNPIYTLPQHTESTVRNLARYNRLKLSNRTRHSPLRYHIIASPCHAHVTYTSIWTPSKSSPGFSNLQFTLSH